MGCNTRGDTRRVVWSQRWLPSELERVRDLAAARGVPPTRFVVHAALGVPGKPRRQPEVSALIALLARAGAELRLVLHTRASASSTAEAWPSADPVTERMTDRVELLIAEIAHTIRRVAHRPALGDP